MNAYYSAGTDTFRSRTICHSNAISSYFFPLKTIARCRAQNPRHSFLYSERDLPAAVFLNAALLSFGSLDGWRLTRHMHAYGAYAHKISPFTARLLQQASLSTSSTFMMMNTAPPKSYPLTPILYEGHLLCNRFCPRPGGSVGTRNLSTFWSKGRSQATCVFSHL